MDSKPKALIKHPEILSQIVVPSLGLELSWVSLGKTKVTSGDLRVSVFITHVCLSCLCFPIGVEWMRAKACFPHTEGTVLTSISHKVHSFKWANWLLEQRVPDTPCLWLDTQAQEPQCWVQSLDSRLICHSSIVGTLAFKEKWKSNHKAKHGVFSTSLFNHMLKHDS